jgi:cell division protein FtsB
VGSDSSAASRSVRGRRPGGRAVGYLLLFATCALVAKALVGESGLLTTRMASRQQLRLAERITGLAAENDALREQGRRLREDLTFIEEIARRDFGLIRPGERVFILRSVPAASSAVAPQTGAPERP